MSTTLNQLVRDQILAEGPQIMGPDALTRREEYTDDALSIMSNVELLERISDALQRALLAQRLYGLGL